MKRMRDLLWIAACLALLTGLTLTAQGAAKKKGKKGGKKKAEAEFLKEFGEDKADLGPTGKNDYFSLEPGTVLTLQGKEDNEDTVLVITVKDETKDVDGVKTRVVEERETAGGKLKEVAINYFAISKKTSNVYYFGEDTKEYENGKVKSTAGTWLSGVNGAHYGMIMPAKPKVGEKYYQEIAEQDKAMDRAETLSVSEKVTVPAGTYENCVKTKETSAVENVTEYKEYAPGVGIVVDGGLKLVKIEKK